MDYYYIPQHVHYIKLYVCMNKHKIDESISEWMHLLYRVLEVTFY